MDVKLELPTAIEGNWQLVDEAGAVIASNAEYPGAALVVQPHFYRHQLTQTIARVHVEGKRGKKSQQSLKIGANAGIIKAEGLDTSSKQITPGFDKDPVKAKKTS